MDHYSDYDICRRALENEIFLGNYHKRKSVKIILYILFLLVLNSYKEIGRKIYVINGKSEKRFDVPEGFEAVYYNNVNINIWGYRYLTTYMSATRKEERFKILFNACTHYFQIKKCKIPFGYYLDYQYWKNFIRSNGIKTVLSNGHYDRLTTQLAHICKETNVQFIIKQHGVLSKTIQIPNRIHVDEVLAFNEMEIEKFKNNIIDGKCKYKKFFKTSVKFVNNAKTGIRIGIIEQPISSMIQIIDIVLETFRNCEVQIMVHPLSKNDYSKYKKNEYVKILNEDKEWNLDLIISTPSTLIYDYLQSGFANPIICIDIDNKWSDLKNVYKNVYYLDNLEELSEKINETNNKIKRQ